MKILVTGGAGFIGSHIVDAYLAAGHEVVVIDDLCTGSQKNVNPKASFYKMDIRDSRLADLFGEEKFDLVNHQAARGNVRASMEDPMVYADVNVRGGINLLESSRKHGVRKFIYSSTGGCVYGEPTYLPADENHPMIPRDPYGASKASFELYMPVYALNYELEYTILRYPNVYGPRQDPFGEAGVVSIFIGQILRGEQPVINGDGEQLRDYIFVSDVVRANMLVLEKGDNEVFNLGSGRGTSVNQIFCALRRILGVEVAEVHGPPKLGEIRRTYLDAEKAHKMLGWAPVFSLEEGLQATIQFFHSIKTVHKDAASETIVEPRRTQLRLG
jgi:UDP-glucose 4-epimerase